MTYVRKSTILKIGFERAVSNRVSNCLLVLIILLDAYVQVNYWRLASVEKLIDLANKHTKCTADEQRKKQTRSFQIQQRQ